LGFVRWTHFRPSGRANYLHILSGLKDAETWAISLSEEMAHHPQQQASVSQVVEKGWLAKRNGYGGDREDHPVRPGAQVLSVEDPQLVFDLRHLNWPDLVRQTGFTRVDVEEEYDFALSFAGEHRPFAQRLYDHLLELGYSVF
jgi:hypothetical protein